ncbi:UPF0149 family protein [Vibrio quintilis]|uniref:YecA family protein n=1 Tax=Vibrio quintilis TaxID=1117707 RepID=A0A1M7Z265_9VIBR|nr:UPF0149 family protein [Vibrio quintilis]SHO58895.1 hypothetical protein VQ7734_04670 [Vibrio quintilis]
MTLNELITRTEQPEQLFTEAQTRGFITALAASPYLIAPEEWISFLWGGAEIAPFSQASDLESYCETVVQLWNQTHEALLSGSWHWPENYETDDELIVNQNVRDLCEGILQGWQLTKDDWENLMPEDSENGALLGGVLLAVSMLYDPDTSLATLQDAGAEGLEQFEEIYEALPAMLAGLAQRGQALAEAQK